MDSRTDRRTDGWTERWTDGWTVGRINKTDTLHTMECYSALTRNDIPTPATTRMNPEDLVLSDMSQPQRDNTV